MREMKSGRAATLLAIIGLGFIAICVSGGASVAQGDARNPTSAAAAALPTSAKDTHPLTSGTVPRGLILTAIGGRSYSLDQALRSHPTILIFYRGGWCPFCNLHLGALQNIEPELTKMGYQTLAISPDPGPMLKDTVEKHRLTYTLLTDTGMRASKAFGLAYRVDTDTLAKLGRFGVDLSRRTGLNPPLLPVPAAYVIDTNGNIRFAYANPDYRVRVDPAILLAEARKALGSK